MNPLFSALGGNKGPQGGPLGMIQQFMEFKKNFKGDPKKEVEKLLQSGRLTQNQLNELQGAAQQFKQILDSQHR